MAVAATVYDNSLDHIVNHEHSEHYTYPTLADPVTVTANASGWTLGDFAEIIPADTITSIYHVRYAEISNISANDEYELRLYSGTTLIATISFTKSASGEPNTAIPFGAPHIPANGQVQAKLACKSLNARTVDIKLYYHLAA